MSLIESTDVVLERNRFGEFDLIIDQDGDFTSADFLDTSLLRSIYGERRALPNEMIVPEMRRGWIGNIYSDHEDGSKVWLYEQSQLNRKTINGVKSEIENGLAWLVKYNAAISYSVSVLIDNELQMTANIIVQRSASKTDNKSYRLFQNSGVTE